MDDILTPKEISSRYRVSVETLKVWRWRSAQGEEGFPPFIKVGRLVRYRVEDFERWIAQKQLPKSHQSAD